MMCTSYFIMTVALDVLLALSESRRTMESQTTPAAPSTMPGSKPERQIYVICRNAQYSFLGLRWCAHGMCPSLLRQRSIVGIVRLRSGESFRDQVAEKKESNVIRKYDEKTTIRRRENETVNIIRGRGVLSIILVPRRVDFGNKITAAVFTSCCSI